MSTNQCDRVLVERYFLNEISGDIKASLRQHLELCTHCQGQLYSLEKERRDYLLLHPFREFVAQPSQAKRLDQAVIPGFKSQDKLTIPRWLPAVAGVAICLMVLPILMTHFNSAGNLEVAQVENGIRTKGEPILEFYYKRGGIFHAGQMSEAYQAGDELQFVYSVENPTFLTLVSLDAKGLVSLYRDEGDAANISLRAKLGNRQTLPFAVTLDNSLGSELFILIYSSKPLRGEMLDGWLKTAYEKASGNLDLLANSLTAAKSSHMADTADFLSKPQMAIKTLLLRKTKV